MSKMSREKKKRTDMVQRTSAAKGTQKETPNPETNNRNQIE